MGGCKNTGIHIPIMTTKGRSGKMAKQPTTATALEVAADYADDFAATINDLFASHATQCEIWTLDPNIGHAGAARLLVNRLVTEKVAHDVVPSLAQYVLSLALDQRPRPQDVEEHLVQVLSMAVRRWAHDGCDFDARETVERLRTLRLGGL